jgi:arsenate reductase (thioredoxin)
MMVEASDTPSAPYQVLFLCTHNSCRSVIAECVLNHIGGGRFIAHSAGSQPSGRVNPDALALLQRLGYSCEGVRSQSWDDFAQAGAPKLNFIFTVCDAAAGESCPYWPGHPVTAHWGVADPSRVDGPSPERDAAFERCHQILRQRLERLVALPNEALGGDTIKATLADIAQQDIA